jgi:hypothetical protein
MKEVEWHGTNFCHCIYCNGCLNLNHLDDHDECETTIGHKPDCRWAKALEEK